MKDKITGFTGIATSQHIYLTGCNQYGLQSQEPGKDGEIRKVEYFDVGRLEIIGEGIPAESLAGAPGGPERERP